MADKLSAAQEKSIAWLKSGKAGKYGLLGLEIGKMMAELVAELADAKLEAEHWKKAFNTVREEIKILAATMIHEGKFERVVITQAQLQAIPKELELHVGTPEPGVRVYELRRRENAKVAQDVGRILRPH